MTRRDLNTPNPDKPVSEPQVYLSRGDVAEIFNVSPNTITRWADAGKLDFVRTLGGHRRYEKETVIDLANSQRHIQEPFQKEEAARVNRLILEIPKLYGDHHVVPIQQLLANRPGIEKVWISPAHRCVQIDFSPENVDADQIRAWLVDGGYPPAAAPVPVPEVAPVSTPARPPKDLAWDHTALRMTQTHGVGA